MPGHGRKGNVSNGYPRGVFDTLSDRLSGIFTKLRGKGRLSDADLDATAREIRLALLEADVALPVVKAFIHRLKAQGSQPLLVAADLQRPNAVNQLQVLGQRAGVEVYAPEPGNGAGDPVAVARESIE